jgi:hypothetical protein
LETGLTGFSTDSGLNFYKCADSPIQPPPLGDIKILSGTNVLAAAPSSVSRPRPPSRSTTGRPTRAYGLRTIVLTATTVARPTICSSSSTILAYLTFLVVLSKPRGTKFVAGLFKSLYFSVIRTMSGRCRAYRWPFGTSTMGLHEHGPEKHDTTRC